MEGDEKGVDGKVIDRDGMEFWDFWICECTVCVGYLASYLTFIPFVLLLQRNARRSPNRTLRT